MTCSACGEKPKKDNSFTKAVVEIDNPGCITLMRKVVVPASMGDDTTVPPVVGKYHNVLLYYEANSKTYLYSSDGIPTQLVNGLTDYEAAINLPQINGNTLIGDKTGEELGLQDKLTAGDNITIENNVISATDTTYGPATDTEIGLVKPGDGLEVATDGTLSVIDHVFDTVADMKASTDLEDGDYARTLGYYTLNDVGGAYYKISSTTLSGYYETLTSGLYAELVVEDTMNVKQFGAKGDGVEDDSSSVETAIANCSNLLIPDGTYLIDKFITENNQQVTGIGNVTIKLKGGAAQAGIRSNNIVTNIHFESTNDSLPWNRVDIADRDNIIITGCSFKNFRGSAAAPNAWGITIRRSSNIVIENCYFENNSQSDIAIVESTDNIKISNCTGAALHINIEPNSSDANKNISITNCDINTLDLQENNYQATATKNVTIKDCTIENFRYDGSTATVINCRVNNYSDLSSSSGENVRTCFGGNLTLINSATFSKNLIEDPYLDTYKRNGTTWKLGYSTFSYANFMSNTIDNDGPVFTINPNQETHTGGVDYKDINVTAGQSYLFRINMKDKTETTGTIRASLYVRLRFKDSNDATIADYNCSINRHSLGETSKMEENSVIFKVPEGATKVGIRVMNSSSNSNNKVTIRSVELYQIDGNQYGSTNLPTLPVRERREFYTDTIPSGDVLTYAVGDRLSYTNPSTYIGAVCTTEGIPGTWSDYGALAS